MQLFLLASLLVLLGGLFCLAVLTDPNVTPNPSRQRLLPIGFAMLFSGIGFFSFVFGIGYLKEPLD
jgi:uncharacterized membrane protein YfcA